MAITKDDIIAAIHEGIEHANTKYEEWSKGYWITDSGIESLMTICIANTVRGYQAQHESIMMEVPLKHIMKESRAQPTPGQKPATIKGNKRADIVLFNGQKNPICIIELKRLWNKSECFKDLKRIRDLITKCSSMKGGTLRRGFLGLMVPKRATEAKSSNDRILEQIGKIKKLICEEFKTNNLKICFHSSNSFSGIHPDWKAASLCIEISSRNSS